MSLIHNERVKLTATYMNGMAIAIVAVGGFAPMVSFASGSPIRPLTLIVMGVGCLAVSVALHYGARKFLGRLQP
ncbi:MAG: amino acid transporter [Candidatus Hydrogenedentes bacterium]|nr:amino acid transporter [Candidatus Hydrogenedentota bacterium]